MHFQDHDPLAVIRTLSDISLFFFFLSDHPLFLYKLGYLPMSLESLDNIDFWNNIFWLGNTVLEIIIETIELALIRGVTATKVSKLTSILQNISDLPIEFYFLGWYPDTCGPHLAGLCGAACSFSCLWNMWRNQ